MSSRRKSFEHGKKLVRQTSAIVVPANLENHDRSLQLKWSDLYFDVAERQILKRQTGFLTAGTVTALMGPSGAGKSTLLNALAGRIERGLSGRMLVTYTGEKRAVRIAFVPQVDAFFPLFTVREVLTFASKMRHGQYADHKGWVNATISNLNMTGCEDTFMMRCSGGQRRRVSVGIELISDPDILMLDEPTTGLDADTAAFCVGILKSIASKTGIAIAASIHQPSSEVFNLFTSIYFLSSFGQCIYFGTPRGMVSYLADHQLVCPKTANPADYMTDVAYGKYGNEVNNEMEKTQVARAEVKIKEDDAAVTKEVAVKKVMRKMRSQQMPYFYQLWVLIVRSFQMSTTRSMVYMARFTFALAMTPVTAFIFPTSPGLEDGCLALDDIVGEVNVSYANVADRLREDLGPVRDDFAAKQASLMNGIVFLFSVTMAVQAMAGLPAVIQTFIEMPFVKKETNNSWYTLHSYVLAKFIADIPGVVFSLTVALSIAFYLTQQPAEPLRLLWVFVYFVALYFVTECMGTLVSLIFNKSMVTSLMAVTSFFFVFFIFAGLLVPLSGMPPLFRFIASLSYQTQGVQGVMVSMYGLGRCPVVENGTDFLDKIIESQNPVALIGKAFSRFDADPNRGNLTASGAAILNIDVDVANDLLAGLGRYLSKFTEVKNATGEAQDTSYYMQTFGLEDSMLGVNLAKICISFVVFRVVTHLVLMYKTRPKRE